MATIPSDQLAVFLTEVGGLLLLAVALGLVARWAGAPTPVGELCAGVLAGPSVLGQVWPGLEDWLFPTDPARFHLLDAVGQIGLILLVGITAMHIDFSLLKRRGRRPWA
jgi:Kef-type K+ transport system membrane component KefB